MNAVYIVGFSWNVTCILLRRKRKKKWRAKTPDKGKENFPIYSIKYKLFELRVVLSFGFFNFYFFLILHANSICYAFLFKSLLSFYVEQSLCRIFLLILPRTSTKSMCSFPIFIYNIFGLTVLLVALLKHTLCVNFVIHSMYGFIPNYNHIKCEEEAKKKEKMYTLYTIPCSQKKNNDNNIYKLWNSIEIYWKWCCRKMKFRFISYHLESRDE